MSIYEKNQNGEHDFKTYLTAARKAEQFISKYYTATGNVVVDVANNKKTDLLVTDPTGKTIQVEVKHNYKKDDTLWLESVSVAGVSKGWMYTSTSDVIVFVSKDFSEVIRTDFKSLQQAFISLIAVEDDKYGTKVYNPQCQTNKGYNSYCYNLPISELEMFGAIFERIDMQQWKEQQIQLRSQPKPTVIVVDDFLTEAERTSNIKYCNLTREQRDNHDKNIKHKSVSTRFSAWNQKRLNETPKK